MTRFFLAVASVLFAAALVVAGCGSSNSADTTTVTTRTIVQTVTAPAASDEDVIRGVVAEFWQADADGDYATVCGLYSPEGRTRAAQDHAPQRSGLTCEEAYQDEADDLGDEFLDAANDISRNTRVLSVAVGRDTAKVVIETGSPDPDVMELERVGDGWGVARTTGYVSELDD